MPHGPKVLVIDDDVIARKILVRTVDSLGFISIQSANGRHAWETLWENPDVSLIITDMMMPDMDGRELVQIVRGNQTFAKLPVLIVSGILSSEDVASLMQLGPCEFCAKPFNADDLKQAIDHLLGNQEKYQT